MSSYEDDLAEEAAIFDALAPQEAEVLELSPPVSTGGRPFRQDPVKLVAWRQAHDASIADTAKRFSVSPATVKRYSRDYKEAAEQARRRWECERLDQEARQGQHRLWRMYQGQLHQALYWVDLAWFSRVKAAEGTPAEAAVASAWKNAMADAERRFVEGWETSMGPVPEYAAPW